MTFERLPLWLRWALSLAAFGALGVVLFAAYRAPYDSGQGGASGSDADRQGRIIVAQDQAPHSSALKRDIAPRLALERAIEADTRRRVRNGELTGPAQEVRCAPAQGGRESRRPFRCVARAGGLGFPFLGVADLRARRLRWCKRDLEPSGDPSLDVPVSRRWRQ